MGRKSLAKERRVEIAHGLYRCIAKQGANTTVRDIARETDIALGVLGMGVGPRMANGGREWGSGHSNILR